MLVLTIEEKNLLQNLVIDKENKKEEKTRERVSYGFITRRTLDYKGLLNKLASYNVETYDLGELYRMYCYLMEYFDKATKPFLDNGYSVNDIENFVWYVTIKKLQDKLNEEIDRLREGKK